MNSKKTLAILGSTGSIGTQALEVVAENAELFEVYAITANRNTDLLIDQARRFQPEVVAVADETKYAELKSALAHLPIKVFAGSDAIAQIAAMEPIDMVLTAMVGYSGLKPTIEAIKAKKAIALANKETLVVAGELINRLIAENEVPVLPVDSEHSAVFQCLAGENMQEVEKVILTASGGPFRTKTIEELGKVNKAQALRHPNWNMGAKITIDSATMMNKGFEVIEAKWLFGLAPEQIDVIVHPESIIHSMVQFADSSIKAQLGLPDMKLPIQYAFSYPRRLANNYPRLSFEQFGKLSFEKADTEKFRCLALAYEAMHTGGNMPCILNAANEIAVAAFLQEKISFMKIAELIEQTMQKASFVKNPDYDDFVASNNEARIIAAGLIGM
ncbi:MAG: 1-deoxy-D-xylulose-5-phosphate reductoisomerase [Prevotellaceae bacterium]|nr:1-deoxy-D-xylulose-5-phosphate reductoisomerase [Prevotellaceae bacterium]